MPNKLTSNFYAPPMQSETDDGTKLFTVVMNGSDYLRPAKQVRNSPNQDYPSFHLETSKLHHMMEAEFWAIYQRNK